MLPRMVEILRSGAEKEDKIRQLKQLQAFNHRLADRFLDGFVPSFAASPQLDERAKALERPGRP